MSHSIKRLVLNFPGFETTSAVHQIERLTAGGAKTASLWGFELERSAIKENESSHKTVTGFKSAADDWQAETRYVHFSWSDIISKYEDVPYPWSFFRHMPGYLAFLFDGSFRRYAKASRRYWGFSIYPILLMIIFGALAYGLSYGLLGDVASHWLALAIPAFVIFLVLCKWPGDRFYINLSINDWAFARDMCKGTNPDIDRRYEMFADGLIKEIQREKPDEILVVGHSFGSVWATVAWQSPWKNAQISSREGA